MIAQELQQTNPEMVYESVKETEMFNPETNETEVESQNILMVEQPNPWELVKLIQDLKQQNDFMKTELCEKDSSYEFC